MKTKINKVISFLLAIVMIIAVAPMSDMGITAQAVSKTSEEAVNWANSKVGQSLDYDGVYGAQCVDLIKYYYKYLGVSPVQGNGCDYATNSLPSGWQRIKYSSGFVPQPGDVAVWTYTTSQYGHVAIITSANSSRMNVVEQNGSTHVTRAHSYSYTYGTFWGVIRPNFSGGSSQPSITYSSISNGEYYLKNNSSGQYLAVSGGADADGQAINLAGKSSQNKVKITKDTNGYVMRFPGVSSSRVINQYSSAPTNGTKVTLYTYSGSKSQSWGFQQVSGGYVIRSMYNQNLCLTGNGSSVATVTNYTGSSNQIWSLEAYAKDTTKPVISNVKVKNITSDGYDITCTVSDNVGVTRVAFPTWTLLNGQDDIIWKNGTISGNTAVFHVNVSDHNNENGKYLTHIYAYDAAENSTNVSVGVIEVPIRGAYKTSYYGNKKYVLYEGIVSEEYAIEYCESLGGRLARITSSKENDTVAEMVKSFGNPCWIDGTDKATESIWLFSNGQKMTYFNWRTGEPNNSDGNQDYIRMYVDGTWDDERDGNNNVYGFVCEFDHSHIYKYQTLTSPTCTTAGKRKCTCLVCEYSYVENVDATGHSYKTTTTKATTSKSGSKVTSCTVCGKVKSKSTIAKISSVKLSTTSYTYNGKTKTPTVTVKDSNGKTLKNGTDYTAKYSSSSRKNVGTYTVTVTFKGNYSGTKKLTFKIVPKSTSISKLTAGKKSFTAKWSKQSTQTTGYQIQYSTSSKMTNATTKTISKNSTTSQTISGLKSSKTYYVRIRTYKTVNGSKIYSSWSSVKSVKVK